MAVDGSWLLDELAIGREHDESSISVTGGTFIFGSVIKCDGSERIRAA